MRAKVSAIALSVLMVMSTFFVAIDVFSATASAESSEEPTIEILNLVATPLDGAVALEWDAPDGVVFEENDYYRVEYSSEEGERGHESVPGNETTKTVEGLTNGVEYTFIVIAIIGGEEICKSEEVTAMPFDAPGAPQNLVATPGEGSVTLTWEAPEDEIVTHYVIYMNGELLKDGEIAMEFIETTAIIDGLTNGEEYRFTVAAVFDGLEGPKSNEAIVTPNNIPAAPLSLVATPGDRSVTLTWEAPEGYFVTHYVVYIDGEVIMDDESAKVFTETTAIIEGLTNGVLYTFTVAAVNDVGEGAKSNEVVVKPAIAPGAPQNLKALPGDGFVKLTWGIPAYDGFMPITHYVIYMNGERLMVDDSVREFIGTTAIIDGLTNEVEYTFKVAAVNGIGEGEGSNEVTVIPIEDIATIDGHVKDGGVPVAGATVSLLDESGNVILDATTDAEGYFSFIDVPVGLYKLNVEKFGYDYDVENAVEVDVESKIHYSLGDISIDPLPAKVELDVDEGTVGLENVYDEESGLTSGSVYAISYTLNGETVEASLGTEVTISGYLYGMGSTEFDVRIRIGGWSGGQTYIVAQGVTDEDGYFSEKFVFPTAPSGEYRIWVVTDSGPQAFALFTVKPGMLLENPVATGPSVFKIVATGFPSSVFSSTNPTLLIDGTDALIGMNYQIYDWRFDRYGTLYNAKTRSDAGFILPVLAPGEYDITLAYMECSVTSSIFVRDIMADLENSIKGEITTIAGDIATIKTELGTIEASLADLDAKIVGISEGMALLDTTLGELKVSLDNLNSEIIAVAGDIATIKTDLGERSLRSSMSSVSLADLNAKVVEIAGDVATIETDLGELRVDLSKQTSVTAGIASGETKVTVDSTPTWIAAVMAVIAAVSAIGSMVILVRKLA
jgi:archaellum component FlaC